MGNFKVKSFERFLQKHGISNADLLTAAEKVVVGNVDADLGGGVYKTQRELKALKAQAKAFGELSTDQIAIALSCGALIEVEHGNDQDQEQEEGC